jgi:hypothetical protein
VRWCIQGVAVVLAKQKWSRLVASERHRDLGLDAHASGDLEPYGKGMGLACSLTAEYDKIAEDATKVKKNYPDVHVLVFSTAWGIRPHRGALPAESLRRFALLDFFHRENLSDPFSPHAVTRAKDPALPCRQPEERCSWSASSKLHG